MSLLSDAVSLADGITKGLGMQTTVTWEAWVDDDGKGGDSFAAPVVVNAVVDRGGQARMTSNGVLVMPVATITILEPLTPNGAANRMSEPVDPRDRFRLSDGSTAPIVETKGPEDPATTRPYLNEITIGVVMR